MHISAVHEKKKDFACNLCGREFSQKGNLNAHISAVHEGEKAFHCSVCDAGFTLQHNLKSHFETVHEGIKIHDLDELQDSYSIVNEEHINMADTILSRLQIPDSEFDPLQENY